MGRVLALDAALWCTGFAVLGDSEELLCGGSIRRPGRDRAKALAHLYKCVACLCDAFHPEAIVMERPGGWARAARHSSQAAVEGMAEARGVVWAVAGNKAVACREMDVAEARRRGIGDGNANKDQALFAVKALGYPLVLKAGEVDGDYVDAVILGLALRQAALEEQLAKTGKSQRHRGSA